MHVYEWYTTQVHIYNPCRVDDAVQRTARHQSFWPEWATPPEVIRHRDRPLAPQVAAPASPRREASLSNSAGTFGSSRFFLERTYRAGPSCGADYSAAWARMATTWSGVRGVRHPLTNVRGGGKLLRSPSGAPAFTH